MRAGYASEPAGKGYGVGIGTRWTKEISETLNLAGNRSTQNLTIEDQVVKIAFVVLPFRCTVAAKDSPDMWSEFTINDVAAVERMLEIMRGVWPSHFLRQTYADVQREAAAQNYNGAGYLFDDGQAAVVQVLGFDRDLGIWRVHASGSWGNITAATAQELTYAKTREFLADRLAKQACIYLPRVPATPIMDGLIQACQADPRVIFQPQRDVGTRVMYMLTIRNLPVS